MTKPIAVITGASGGVGSACVAEFRAAGFWTVGVDVKPESTADQHVEVDMVSVTCGDEVAAAVGERPIEALVNNAAAGSDTTLLETTAESWDGLMAVNLRAPFLTSRALYPRLLESGRGAVVNIASVHALASSDRAGAYATSKAGLLALTRAMALEWAPAIRATCVLPGAVDTEMIRQGLRRTGQTMEQLETRQPLGRIATPAEIAKVVRFLATEATFMTGSTLVVDGGVLSRLSSE